MIDNLEFWHWFALALILTVVEISLLGSYFLLWIAGAAAFVGGVLLINPALGEAYQLSIWSIASVIGVGFWAYFRKKNPNGKLSDEPNLNRRGTQYVGKIYTLDEDIVNGGGRLKIGDSFWAVQASQDIKAGTSVKVIEEQSTVLTVEKV